MAALITELVAQVDQVGRQCGASLKIAGREIGHGGDRFQTGCLAQEARAEGGCGPRLDGLHGEGGRQQHGPGRVVCRQTHGSTGMGKDTGLEGF